MMERLNCFTSLEYINSIINTFKYCIRLQYGNAVTFKKSGEDTVLKGVITNVNADGTSFTITQTDTGTTFDYNTGQDSNPVNSIKLSNEVTDREPERVEIGQEPEKVKIGQETATSLQLQIKDTDTGEHKGQEQTIASLIENYVSKEDTVSDEQIFVNGCRGINKESQFEIELTPENMYIVFSIKRFDNARNKLRYRTVISERITIGGTEFVLVGLVLQVGDSIRGGHYVYVGYKGGDTGNIDSFFEINDSRYIEYIDYTQKQSQMDNSNPYKKDKNALPTSSENIETIERNVYMLLYKKK
jgi:hypothetical protein